MLRKALSVGGLFLVAAALALATPGVGRAQYDGGARRGYYHSGHPYRHNGWRRLAPYYGNQYYSYPFSFGTYPYTWPSAYEPAAYWSDTPIVGPYSVDTAPPARPFVGGPPSP